jgi:hypothetical protein
MVRRKQVISPTKEAEIREKVQAIKEQCYNYFNLLIVIIYHFS